MRFVGIHFSSLNSSFSRDSSRSGLRLCLLEEYEPVEFSIIVYSLPMDVLHDDSLVFVRYSEEVNSSETLASSFHNRAISFLCFIFSINILLS